MKIKSTKPFISEFNGTPVTLATNAKTGGEVIGTSGQTKRTER